MDNTEQIIKKITKTESNYSSIGYVINRVDNIFTVELIDGNFDVNKPNKNNYIYGVKLSASENNAVGIPIIGAMVIISIAVNNEYYILSASDYEVNNFIVSENLYFIINQYDILLKSENYYFNGINISGNELTTENKTAIELKTDSNEILINGTGIEVDGKETKINIGNDTETLNTLASDICNFTAGNMYSYFYDPSTQTNKLQINTASVDFNLGMNNLINRINNLLT